MRFSTAFEQLAALRRPSTVSAQSEPGQALPSQSLSRPVAPQSARLPPEVPIDLDQRVRLIGEW